MLFWRTQEGFPQLHLVDASRDRQHAVMEKLMKVGGSSFPMRVFRDDIDVFEFVWANLDGRDAARMMLCNVRLHCGRYRATRGAICGMGPLTQRPSDRVLL